MVMTAPPQPAPPPAPRRRRRLPKAALVIAAVFLAGVMILLYPSGAGWFAAIGQSAQVNAYTREVTVIPPAGQAQALDQAHAYNRALDAQGGGAIYAAGAGRPQGQAGPAGFDYAKLLRADPYGMMATLQIPAIGLNLPIYHGSSDTVLARGVGHLQGTSLPVGGPGTHAVLTGHRGLPTATLFTNLNKVHRGDRFTINVFGRVLTYRVATVQVVYPNQTRSLAPVPGKDLVTLVTCTPLGINNQRILVTGERIPTPQAAARAATAPAPVFTFPWWALWLAATLAVLTLYVRAAGRRVPRTGETPRRRRL